MWFSDSLQNFQNVVTIWNMSNFISFKLHNWGHTNVGTAKQESQATKILWTIWQRITGKQENVKKVVNCGHVTTATKTFQGKEDFKKSMIIL